MKQSPTYHTRHIYFRVSATVMSFWVVKNTFREYAAYS
jgi:hypothetical protein